MVFPHIKQCTNAGTVISVIRPKNNLYSCIDFIHACGHFSVAFFHSCRFFLREENIYIYIFLRAENFLFL